MPTTLQVLLLASLWLLPGLWDIGYRMRRRVRALAEASLRERALAAKRSRELLRDVLDEREYRQLTERGYVDVASPTYDGRLYRIPCSSGRVRVYEHGRAQVELCIQPASPLPVNDIVVLHLLMIKGNEQGYLACANEIPLDFPSRIYDNPRWSFLAM